MKFQKNRERSYHPITHKLIMNTLFKETKKDTTQDPENKNRISLTCKHNVNPRKIEDYALSNNLMSISRSGMIYENIVDYELLAHCLVFDELMSQSDCSLTFTKKEQEIISSYYQNVPIHNTDLDVDLHTNSVMEGQLKKMLILIFHNK